MIYDAYFASLQFHLLSRRNILPGERAPLSCRPNAKAGTALAILATSKSIRQEALPLLGAARFEISALFSGWRRYDRDVLGIHPMHTEHIHTVHLAFLESNYSLLRWLPKLQRVLIDPPGEVRCHRFDVPGDSRYLWNDEDIAGDLGLLAMKQAITGNLKLNHSMLKTLSQQMTFDFVLNVGFKFLVKDMSWSHGRQTSTRAHFRSTVGEAAVIHPPNSDLEAEMQGNLPLRQSL